MYVQQPKNYTTKYQYCVCSGKSRCSRCTDHECEPAHQKQIDGDSPEDTVLASITVNAPAGATLIRGPILINANPACHRFIIFTGVPNQWDVSLSPFIFIIIFWDASLGVTRARWLKYLNQLLLLLLTTIKHLTLHKQCILITITLNHNMHSLGGTKWIKEPTSSAETHYSWMYSM